MSLLLAPFILTLFAFLYTVAAAYLATWWTYLGLRWLWSWWRDL